MTYAVFCIRKNHNRAIDPPCMDPLDYGVGDEPDHDLLLRRGRVGLFDTEEEAESALKATFKAAPSGSKWLKAFSFMVVKCMARGGRDQAPSHSAGAAFEPALVGQSTQE